jgi:hypothetical protein
MTIFFDLLPLNLINFLNNSLEKTDPRSMFEQGVLAFEVDIAIRMLTHIWHISIMITNDEKK